MSRGRFHGRLVVRRSTTHRAALVGILAAAIAFGTTGPADAQTLRGQVLEDGTEAAIAGALVLLISPDGKEQASAVSGGTGAYVIRVPSPGEWSLRVERIGFASSTAGPFRLASGADRSVPLVVSSVPVALPTITVESEKRGICGLNPVDGETVWRLWDEARKALQVSQIVEGQIVFETEVMERFVDPFDTTIGHEYTDFNIAAGRSPFDVPSPEDLQERGFVRDSADGGLAFYGPDATVLLSDTFQESHCFRAVRGNDGLVGLAFEPAQAPLKADIRGTLWLEAATSELVTIDFEYAGLRPRGDLGVGPEASGLVVYDQIENGGWIVRRWRIRIPIDSAEYGGRTYKVYVERSGRVTGTRANERKAGQQQRIPSVYDHGARRDTTSP
ncbi:MAG: carboxypeptidase regulatory-like domain-containing protein [Gemmatimonadetes bacterium]|nr:carboxypeptidase regulatory-like domain-containing protein [Gemmatimonadota bacterium]